MKLYNITSLRAGFLNLSKRVFAFIQGGLAKMLQKITSKQCYGQEL